jgi:hypothetical protein
MTKSIGRVLLALEAGFVGGVAGGSLPQSIVKSRNLGPEHVRQ